MNLFFSSRRSQRGFIEKNIAGVTGALDHAAFADETTRRDGWLQTLDPRGKIVGFAAFIVAAVSARRLDVILGIFFVGLTLAALSHLPVRRLMTPVWLGVLVFTGVIALPAIFLTPGNPVGRLPVLDWPVTATGLRSAALLVAHAETTVTLALTLVFSTPWTHVLKSLRVLRVPGVVVVILGMTYRYIFLLLHLAEDVFVARRSRLVGGLAPAQRRQIAAGAAGALLDRSLQLSGEVYQAMQSRGFRGEIHTLDDFRWHRRDTFALFGFLAFAVLAGWLGQR